MVTLNSHNINGKKMDGNSNGLNGQMLIGQVLVHDFLVMTVLLIALITMFLIVWNSLAFHWDRQQDSAQLESESNALAALLVSSQGTPPSWERLPAGAEAQIASLGFAYQEGSLSMLKLSRAEDWSTTDYTSFKQRLGVFSREVHITVFDPIANLTLVAIGQSPPANSTRARAVRMAIYNGTIVQFAVTLWHS